MSDADGAVKQKLQKLHDRAAKEVTENILPFWMHHVVDHEHGGFYGAVLNDRTPVKEADKSLVLNCRLVWTFASAYRIFGEPRYLEMAERAYEYLIRYFWDEECAGAYWMLDYRGTPVETNKLTYGQSFTLYALSEYHRATGEPGALQRAIALFHALEKFVFDPVNKGYWEICDRRWQHTAVMQTSDVNPEGTGVWTMNTHLHLLEAYTCLLRVWDSDEIRAKVRENLHLMIDNVVDKTIAHYKMFFDEQWHPVFPNISYGHDIEGSWLMMETCEVLGDHATFEWARDVCLKIAQACLDEGVEPDGSMIYEKDPITGHSDASKSWWVQAEAVVGFLNAYEMSGREYFLDAAIKSLDYIDRVIVDHEYGEWFASAARDMQARREVKVDAWKCPYHNSRMGFEIVERYRRRERESSTAGQPGG